MAKVLSQSFATGWSWVCEGPQARVLLCVSLTPAVSGVGWLGRIPALESWGPEPMRAESLLPHVFMHMVWNPAAAAPKVKAVRLPHVCSPLLPSVHSFLNLLFYSCFFYKKIVLDFAVSQFQHVWVRALSPSHTDTGVAISVPPCLRCMSILLIWRPLCLPESLPPEEYFWCMGTFVFLLYG